MAEPTVDAVYEAFAGVRRPARVTGCPHCVNPDEDRPLLARPMRALPPEELARYAAKALTTWGGVEEFRYFLPRLLECARADAFGHPDPPIVFGKLASAGWRGWAEGERGPIEGFLTAWWAGTLDRHPAEPPVGTVLCCLGATGADLDPFLARWGRLRTAGEVRHLHDFVLHEVRWTGWLRLADAFWDRNGVAYGQVVAWLTGGRAAAAVEAAFAAAAGEDVLGLLAEIHSVLT
ncbi:hypothetical protein [Actinomadura sp. DC4]|uniref:hypothetical protein n=1 Tax=Actinomadura sp. DC4 TaxID=3055069 RepID=UPI0025B04B53|nr:hypothetical protein [Actinomadura sp. DC4]MDN3351729.1 hypothetical protein [Actinomadura sp. DC4]